MFFLFACVCLIRRLPTEKYKPSSRTTKPWVCSIFSKNVIRTFLFQNILSFLACGHVRMCSVIIRGLCLLCRIDNGPVNRQPPWTPINMISFIRRCKYLHLIRLLEPTKWPRDREKCEYVLPEKKETRRNLFRLQIRSAKIQKNMNHTHRGITWMIIVCKQIFERKKTEGEQKNTSYVCATSGYCAAIATIKTSQAISDMLFCVMRLEWVFDVCLGYILSQCRIHIIIYYSMPRFQHILLSICVYYSNHKTWYSVEWTNLHSIFALIITLDFLVWRRQWKSLIEEGRKILWRCFEWVSYDRSDGWFDDPNWINWSQRDNSVIMEERHKWPRVIWIWCAKCTHIINQTPIHMR